MPIISSKNTDAYMNSQPKGDPFERHKELSQKRTVSGFPGQWMFWRKGRGWKTYNIDRKSPINARMQDMLVKCGDPIHHSQWEFADKPVKKKWM